MSLILSHFSFGYLFYVLDIILGTMAILVIFGLIEKWKKGEGNEGSKEKESKGKGNKILFAVWFREKLKRKFKKKIK